MEAAVNVQSSIPVTETASALQSMPVLKCHSGTQPPIFVFTPRRVSSALFQKLEPPLARRPNRKQ